MAGLSAVAPERYEIPIRSRSVSRLYVQSGFDIQIIEHDAETRIRVADPIAVVTENSDPLLRQAGGPEPRSFGRIVVSGSALRAGSALEVVFDPDVWFWIEAEHTGKTFGPYGSKGLMLVCMPSGEMAIWFGTRPSRTTEIPVAGQHDSCH